MILMDPKMEQAFMTANYAVETPGGSVQFRIGDSIEQLRGQPFALLTGYNPGGMDRTPGVNRAANRRLAAALARGPWQVFDGASYDEQGGHRERQFAVFGIPRGEALALARDFGQAAIVWFDGHHAELAWTQEAEAGEGR